MCFLPPYINRNPGTMNGCLVGLAGWLLGEGVAGKLMLAPVKYTAGYHGAPEMTQTTYKNIHMIINHLI